MQQESGLCLCHGKAHKKDEFRLGHFQKEFRKWTLSSAPASVSGTELLDTVDDLPESSAPELAELRRRPRPRRVSAPARAPRPPRAAPSGRPAPRGRAAPLPRTAPCLGVQERRAPRLRRPPRRAVARVAPPAPRRAEPRRARALRPEAAPPPTPRHCPRRPPARAAPPPSSSTAVLALAPHWPPPSASAVARLAALHRRPHPALPPSTNGVPPARVEPDSSRGAPGIPRPPRAIAVVGHATADPATCSGRPCHRRPGSSA
ncbi:uncharacterized protein [Miscanthus floridulus]|uniref:uncharacterized protein n=1 Tax=Miscanthus floridulus TaxID=154761 RepID=UPI003457F196